MSWPLRFSFCLNVISQNNNPLRFHGEEHSESKVYSDYYYYSPTTIPFVFLFYVHQPLLHYDVSLSM